MLRTLVGTLHAFALAAPLAVAAQYPGKPVRVVVPFPAGSATDTITRILANSVSQSVGQPLVVENKAGADGAIAAAEVAKSPADGYTLLMATNSPMSAVPAMKKNPPYDPVSDFTPITDIGRYTFFIVLHPSVPAKTLSELIAYARANPGKINYATGNTTGIVSTAFFASQAQIKMVHVPYKGEPQAITDLVAGRVQLMFASSSTSVPHVREGRLHAVVTTLPKRSALLPDVPSIAEAGHAAVLDHVLGRAFRPRANAARGRAAPQQGVRRCDEAPGRAIRHGAPGLYAQPFDARAPGRVREGADGKLPPHAARGRRRAGVRP